MKTPFTGGCACGAVRYECSAEPLVMLQCHCRDCQRASGGPYSTLVIVTAKSLRLVQGALRFHASPSEMGGHTRRGFCADCGSPIEVRPDALSHLVALRSASLDDPSWFKPQMEVWTADAHMQDCANPAPPKFEKYPPAKAKG